MRTPAVCIGCLLASMTTTGCTALMPYGGAYGRYPMMRPAPMPMPAVDPYMAALGRWDSVMRLPRGSVIDVLEMNGTAHVGKITRVDGYSVGVMVNASEREIPRAEIVRVDLVDLPGSEVGAAAKGAGLGAALGVGAMALVGAVIGGSAWPPPGAMLRAGAAIGGVAGAESSLIARQKRLIYLAEHQRITPPDYTQGPPPRPIQSYSVNRWDTIAQLPAATAVTVVTLGGARHQGALVAVDDTAIRLTVGDAEIRILRTSIARVEVLSTPNSKLPTSNVQALRNQ